MPTAAERIEKLETELAYVKAEMKVLVDYLATIPDLPILGPHHKFDYEGIRKGRADVDRAKKRK